MSGTRLTPSPPPSSSPPPSPPSSTSPIKKLKRLNGNQFLRSNSRDSDDGKAPVVQEPRIPESNVGRNHDDDDAWGGIDEGDEVIFLPNSKKSSCSTIVNNIGTVVMYVAGLGAGILYLAPSEICAESGSGQFLSDLITKHGAHYVLFASGFIGFGISNSYFSGVSLPRLNEFMSEQKTLASKLWKGSGILVLTLSQAIPVYLISKKTGSNFLETTLTTAGAVPGALRASVELVDRDIPRFLAKTQEAMRRRMGCLSGSHPIAQHVVGGINERQRKYDVFMNNVDRYWTCILQAEGVTISRVIIQDILSPNIDKNTRHNSILKGLYDEYAPADRNSTYLRPWRKACRGLNDLVVGIAATGLIVSFTAPIVNTTNSGVQDEFSSGPVGVLLTIFFNLANIYNNIDLTNKGIYGVYEGVKNLFVGQSLFAGSLAFKLYPKLTAFAAAAGVGIESLSIAVIDNMAREMINDYKISEPYSSLFLYTALTGIAIYHASGLYELYKILLSRFVHDDQAKALFAIEREIEDYKTMSLDAFAKRIQVLDPAVLTTHYGVQVHGQLADDEEKLLIRDDSISTRIYQQPPFIDVETRVPEEKRGWCDTIWSFFHCGKRRKAENTFSADHHDEVSHSPSELAPETSETIAVTDSNKPKGLSQL